MKYFDDGENESVELILKNSKTIKKFRTKIVQENLSKNISSTKAFLKNIFMKNAERSVIVPQVIGEVGDNYTFRSMIFYNNFACK